MVLKSIWLTIGFAVFLTTSLTSCASIRYYGQLISGQIGILNKREPIRHVLAQPDASEKLKLKLKLVLEIREFAKDKLFLPAKDQYLSFVDLERPFAVYNVFATPEFSFSPKTWCYPIIGCAVYRGYFSKKDAFNYADQLRKKGYDVYIGGVVAYSTLGWFDDPVLSTFINLSDIKLAALIFHELSHHLLYVADDTTFNESFATAVERESLRRWLLSKNRPKAYGDYMKAYRRQQQFIKLVLKYRKKLEVLYAKDLPVLEKRHDKAVEFDNLKADYRLLKKQWGGYSGYEGWFNRKMNNAQLLTVATYNDLVPAFLKLLKTCNSNLKTFYKKCQELSKKPKKVRRAYLDQLLDHSDKPSAVKHRPAIRDASGKTRAARYHDAGRFIF
ncbi:MAG: aminopeptidase [Desulfobacterales bacterium]